MDEKKFELLKKIMENDEVVSLLASAGSAADYQKIFGENGLGLSEEECVSIFDAVKQYGNEELSEADLEDAAGGIGIGTGLLIVGGAYVAGRIYGAITKNKMPFCR